MARNGDDPIQQYRGTTEQHQAYTGPIGEITVDTTKKTAVVQDGATPGGHPLMREDAPDELTIMRTDDGHIQGMDIAIGGDPTDLASARGQIGNTPTVGPHDFSTGMLAEKSGLYAAYQSGSTNAPFAGPYAELISRIGGQAGSILFSSGKTAGQRAALGTVSSINGFGGYNRLITEEQIGDGIRATDGILSVPEYEGATATQPGTAGLVNPATPEERDYVYHGDGTWREITSVGSGKLAHAEINTYHKRNVVVTPASFDVGELYYGDDISTTGRVFTQKVNDGIKILEDGIYNVLLEIGVNNTASITGDLVFGTKLVARESEKLSSPIVMSTSSIYVNTIAADIDSGSVTIAKSFKAGDIIAPYLAIQQGDVFNLQWVSVVLTKFPSGVSTEYQVQNAEYFGCYQREWVLSPVQVLPEDATKKFTNIDWTLGNTVNENPNALSIVPNKGVVPSRTGLVLLNFGLTVNLMPGTNVYDLVCQVFRRNAAGQDVLVRTGTFRLYEGQINADLFNLVILVPMQEGDGVWFRILVPAVFTDLGYVASLSGTVFPSVIDQTVVHYKHQSYTEYQDGTKLSFPVTAKTWIDCPSEQFTSIGPFFDLFSVYENHWKVKRAGTYKITFCTSVPNSSITDAGYLCHIGILDMKGLVLGQYEIDYSNVPITDGIGTVECVKDFAEGEEFRTCFLYGKAGTAYVGKTIVSLLWLDADKNVIDIPDIDIFTAPTASAPGKAGLVPGPAAATYPQNVILTADKFQEVDLAFMHPTVESAELNKTRMDMGGEGNETLNIDTLLRCGFFSAYTFSGTLPTADTGGFLLNCFTLGVIDRKYWGTQILVQTANTYVRRAQAGIDPGDTPVWGAWTTLNAPRPQAANGAGQWKNIGLNASSYTLPQGHTWACQILGLRESDGRIVVAQAGVYAGGTVFNWSSAGIGTIVGFAWRITG